MTVVDCLLVCVVSLVLTSLNLLLEYLFVYSKKSYKDLRDEISRKKKAIQKLRDGAPSAKREKRVTQGESQLSEMNTRQSAKRFGVMLIMPIILMSALSVVNRVYQGYPVVSLPFTPFSMLQRLTQRGLPLGTDPSLASATVVYILASAAIRPNLARLFGISTEQPSLFSMPSQ